MKKWFAACTFTFVLLFAALYNISDKNDSLAWQEGADPIWGVILASSEQIPSHAVVAEPHSAAHTLTVTNSNG